VLGGRTLRVKLSNVNWTCVDMLIKCGFMQFSLNIINVVVESSLKVLEFDFKTWATMLDNLSPSTGAWWVTLHWAGLVLGWVTAHEYTVFVFNQSPRPTQPGHPFTGRLNEYWQSQLPLAKKQQLLCKVSQVTRTGGSLAYWYTLDPQYNTVVGCCRPYHVITRTTFYWNEQQKTLVSLSSHIIVS